MNNENSVSKAYEVYINELYDVANKAMDIFKQETEKGAEKAYEEFGKYQKAYIQSKFNEYVSAFYSAYQPHKYKRTEGLYEVLSLETDEHGIVQYDSYDELFDETKMHPDRSGNDSLFDIVFKQGYHGGAPSIDSSKAEIWGEHPDPGTPYYRRGGYVKYPGSDKRKWHRYGRWGRRAVRTKAPYVMMYEWLSEAEGGEMFDAFKAMQEKHFNDAIPKVSAKISELMKTING